MTTEINQTSFYTLVICKYIVILIMIMQYLNQVVTVILEHHDLKRNGADDVAYGMEEDFTPEWTEMDEMENSRQIWEEPHTRRKET